MDQAESLRNIIKKQEIDEKKRTARVITVTSGKGGVGKTSFSVNLAIQLHRLGKRVVVLDADFGLANIEIMLGIRPKYNLADLMFRGKSIQDVMTYGPEGIGFLSGGSGINEMANLNREQVFWLIQKMEELEDVYKRQAKQVAVPKEKCRTRTLRRIFSLILLPMPEVPAYRQV